MVEEATPVVGQHVVEIVEASGDFIYRLFIPNGAPCDGALKVLKRWTDFFEKAQEEAIEKLDDSITEN